MHQQTTQTKDEDGRQTFETTFFPTDAAPHIKIPDYQRAYAWEQKQLELFIGDLIYYKDKPKDYYFGHFISEQSDQELNIVDGQQRLTTFVLFLIVCRQLAPDSKHRAFQLIDRFSTVGYDMCFLDHLRNSLTLEQLEELLQLPEKDPDDASIVKALGLKADPMTHSQKRIALALRQFFQAFNGQLEQDKDSVESYIEVIMKGACSHHLAKGKSVAVNIFEMHNTRGVALSTMEIVKAKLMKFVYDNGADDKSKNDNVTRIQELFGEIYALETQLEESTFRGELSLEFLLRLHLRVIDDGNKKSADEFRSPPTNANAEALVQYIDDRLRYEDQKKQQTRNPQDGLDYARNLTKEFRKSVKLVSTSLPKWDEVERLVGDVIIQEKQLSYQFFLLLCRSTGSEFKQLESSTLGLWEKLLYTRDFHNKYYNLKGQRDNFPQLFAECLKKPAAIDDTIKKYLKDGFRPKKTKDLQEITRDFLKHHKPQILNNAYGWWKEKMTYAIYKYEQSQGANLRPIMKASISVEHILPQDWKLKWLSGDLETDIPGSARDTHYENIGMTPNEFNRNTQEYINGIGNLLLLTSGKNSSEGNKHPKDKDYTDMCVGGTYSKHEENKKDWPNSNNWEGLIHDRGQEIYGFIFDHFFDTSKPEQNNSEPDKSPSCP